MFKKLTSSPSTLHHNLTLAPPPLDLEPPPPPPPDNYFTVPSLICGLQVYCLIKIINLSTEALLVTLAKSIY